MLQKILKTFDAPDFYKYFLIPFAIITSIGYIFGLPFIIRDVKKGGYNTITYDDTCVKMNEERCKEILNPKEYQGCVAIQNELRCESTKGKGGSAIPVLLYLILPLIISFTLSIMLYKLLIFIKNPKVAAGYILAKSLRE